MASDLFQRGAAWLAEKQRAAASVAIIYRRGDETIEIDATRSRHDVEAYGDADTDLTAHIEDFIVTADHLAIAGLPIEPIRGDSIELAEPAEPPEIFQVLPIAGDRCYRWSDPDRVIMRIHTKRTLKPL